MTTTKTTGTAIEKQFATSFCRPTTILDRPIFFENLNLNLELIDGIQANDTYLTFIKCNGTSSEGQVKITNSKFKLDFDKTGNSFETFVYPLYILTETETKYNFLINECEFEYLETNRVGGDITFELIKAARISVEGDKYNMVSFFNSFTNTDYHIDINSQNVLKDSDFKILN